MGIRWECIKNFFKKPFTIKYPYVTVRPYKKFRGRIKYNHNKCIGCRLCEKNCPAKAIIFYKKGKITFNMGECMYCGLCVDVCPVNAINFTTEFEYASKDKKEFIIT